MKTVLELLLFTRTPEGFHVVPKELDISQEDRNPDSIADDYIKYLFQDSLLIADRERYILHSTSWRYMPPRTLYLTYAVYSDFFSFAHLGPILLKETELHIEKTKNPQIPRPETISLHAVCSHALRHVAFLLRDDKENVYARVLTDTTKECFSRISASLAGELL